MDRIDERALLDTMKRELFSGILGDVMDGMGMKRQFLPPEVRALDPKMILAGRAVPVVHAPGRPPDGSQYGCMLEALDSLAPGDVWVIDGEGADYALWGELMATRAARLGSAGVVVNGFHRDSSGILGVGFPTFSRGAYAQDVTGRAYVSEYRVAIRIGGVEVAPGDIVFGDRDGVLVVPAGVAGQVVEQALEKVRGESQVRRAFGEGMTAVEAFRRYQTM